jgi:hypothetical protein
VKGGVDGEHFVCIAVIACSLDAINAGLDFLFEIQ